MANANLAELIQYYSGGGSNSTTTASTGGAISTSRVLSQTASAFTTMTGVTVDDAMGNAVGDGTFTFTSSGQTVQWTPSGGAIGTAVDVSADGVFFVQAANDGGGLSITVVAASLPTSNVTNTLTIANQTEKHYLDQTKDESDVSATKYHCFAYKNTSAETMKDVTLYISSNTPGADTINIALDPLAASNGAVGPTDTTNEDNAPTITPNTFGVPDSKDHADAVVIGDLLTTEVRFFWIKQITPSGVTTATTANDYNIGVYTR
ncbi:MAG: hypothetical protein KAJ03_12410, partial [Gammaproteobacteria bacterium]|nr:hypothetical protein [Gammaproteobacteria bacterium]